MSISIVHENLIDLHLFSNGSIKNCDFVTCLGCHKPKISFSTLKDFESGLKKLGWRLRNKSWYCPTCSAKFEKETEGEK